MHRKEERGGISGLSQSSEKEAEISERGLSYNGSWVEGPFAYLRLRDPDFPHRK